MMNKPWRAVLSVVVVFAACAVAAAEKPAESLLPKGKQWQLTFQDEFDGKQVDEKRWSPRDYGEFIRNNELQAYVPEAFSVASGVLRVTAEKRERKYAGKIQQYTSGMMITKGKFSQQYGYFEIRCRCPAGKGLWPAYWLLEDRNPQPWPPEIDVLEFLGHDPKTMYFTIHWKTKESKTGRKSSGGKAVGPDFTQEFHTIGCEWDAKEVKWYCDGVVKHQYSGEGVPHVPMYLMVNLAVGGNWPGAPNEQTPFPSAFEVDFVRVYQAVK